MLLISGYGRLLFFHEHMIAHRNHRYCNNNVLFHSCFEPWKISREFLPQASIFSNRLVWHSNGESVGFFFDCNYAYFRCSFSLFWTFQEATKAINFHPDSMPLFRLNSFLHRLGMFEQVLVLRMINTQALNYMFTLSWSKPVILLIALICHFTIVRINNKKVHGNKKGLEIAISVQCDLFTDFFYLNLGYYKLFRLDLSDKGPILSYELPIW